MEQQDSKLLILGLLFHPSTANYGWDMGGAEKRFLQLCKYLAKWSDTVHVIEPTPSLSHRGTTKYQFFEINLDSKISNLFGRNLALINWFIKGLPKAIALCKENNYDVILAHDVRIFDLLIGVITSRLFKIPLVTIAHHLHWIDMSNPVRHNYSFLRVLKMEMRWGANFFEALLRSTAAFLESKLLDYVDYYISVSDSTARYLVMNGVSSNKIMVSGNGVDIEFIHSVENHCNERYDAIYVGRLYGGKGIFDLIKAWKLVVSRDKDARLVVIGGTDANEQKPHELVNELGLSNNVVFKGYVSDKEVVEYLKSAKVFVLPSKMEGWGISVAEAVTCGLPVILYSIQSLYENFSDYNGAFFVPTGNIEALAKTILHVLNLSEEKCEEIRNHALEICNRFDLPNLFAKEHELLHQVVNKATLKESTILLQR